MTDITIKPEADRIFGYQFEFKGKRYAFHQWVQSPTEPYQILVTEIDNENGIYKRGKVVAGEPSNPITTNSKGGTHEFYKKTT